MGRKVSDEYAVPLCSGVVVEEQMQIEMCGRLAVDCFQKRQELVCPMTRQAFADDGTGRHIQRGEECCGAVALVIMGHRAGTALFQGQTRLRAVECLNLAHMGICGSRCSIQDAM